MVKVKKKKYAEHLKMKWIEKYLKFCAAFNSISPDKIQKRISV